MACGPRLWKKVVAPVSSRGADWRPQPGSIHGKQIKHGNQAEAETRFFLGRPGPEHPLPVHIHHRFLIKVREAEDPLVTADAGAAEDILRVGLGQGPPELLIHFGATVIEHRIDP